MDLEIPVKSGIYIGIGSRFKVQGSRFSPAAGLKNGRFDRRRNYSTIRSRWYRVEGRRWRVEGGGRQPLLRSAVTMARQAGRMPAIYSDSFLPRPRARPRNQNFIADEGRVRGRRRGRNPNSVIGCGSGFQPRLTQSGEYT